MKQPCFGAKLLKGDWIQRAAHRDLNPAIPFCDTSYPTPTKLEALLYGAALVLVLAILIAPWVWR